MKYFIALLLIFFAAFPALAAEKESAYERVMRTNTLRCGYGYWEPMVMRDEKTDAFHGAFVEFMEAIGKVAGWRVEWTETVDWGQIPVALQSGRIDAMCASVWPSTKRGKQLLYTEPFVYLGVDAYARADDESIQKVEDINREDVKFIMVDGDVEEEIGDFYFPKAQKISLPQLANVSEKFLMMAGGNGDATVTTHIFALGYIRENPGKIKHLTKGKPIRIYGNTIALDIHEHELRAVLNTAIRELHQSGVTDSILNKYEPDYPGGFLRVAKPYETPQ